MAVYRLTGTYLIIVGKLRANVKMINISPVDVCVSSHRVALKTGKRKELWEIQHEVVCVPGQQWQHIDI